MAQKWCVCRENRGPAAARNAGWTHAATPFVLFVDADVTLPTDWSAALAQFDDPTVGVVVPRVHSTTDGSPSLVERYEAAHSPYDLGEDGGDIGVERRISYAACLLLLVRVEALKAVDGFADNLRFGEDLDLVRRLEAADWVVRYEPRWEGAHRARSRFGPLLRLHYRYGVPAAEVDRRSGFSAGTGTTSLLAWVAVLFAVVGAPVVAVAAGVLAVLLTLAALSSRVGSTVAARVAVRAEVKSFRTAAAAVSTTWFVPSLAIAAFAHTWFGAAFVVGVALLRHTTTWRHDASVHQSHHVGRTRPDRRPGLRARYVARLCAGAQRVAVAAAVSAARWSHRRRGA